MSPLFLGLDSLTHVGILPIIPPLYSSGHKIARNSQAGQAIFNPNILWPSTAIQKHQKRKGVRINPDALVLNRKWVKSLAGHHRSF